MTKMFSEAADFPICNMAGSRGAVRSGFLDGNRASGFLLRRPCQTEGSPCPTGLHAIGRLYRFQKRSRAARARVHSAWNFVQIDAADLLRFEPMWALVETFDDLRHVLALRRQADCGPNGDRCANADWFD